MTTTQDAFKDAFKGVIELVQKWRDNGRSGFSLPVLRDELLASLEQFAISGLEITTTQDLCTRLDEKYPGWDMYRSAMRKWIFQLRRSNAPNIVLEGDTIDEVLQAAMDYKDLPVIPPRPKMMGMNLVEVQRDGSKWKIMYDRRFLRGNFSTKKAATYLAEKIVANNNETVEAWDSRYVAIVSGGVEGIDFVYGY